jgi:HEAT repeat protein
MAAIHAVQVWKWFRRPESVSLRRLTATVLGSWLFLINALPALAEDSELARKLKSAESAEARIKVIEEIEALSANEGVPLVPNLSEYVQDPDHDVRIAAFNAVSVITMYAKLPCPRLIVDALSHSDADIRHLASSYCDLYETIPAEFTPQFLKAMVHPDVNVRRGIPQALRKAGSKDERTIPALRKGMQDDDLMVAYNSSISLYHASGELAEVLPYWLKLADRRWEAIPRQDQPVKSNEPPESLIEEVESIEIMLQRNAGHFVQTFAREQPEKFGKGLLPFLKDEVPRLRRSAADALGLIAADNLKSREVLDRLQSRDALRPLQSDPVESVRAAAARALERFSVEIPPPTQSPASP